MLMQMKVHLLALLILGSSSLVADRCLAEMALEKALVAAKACEQLKEPPFIVESSGERAVPAEFMRPSDDILCLRGSFYWDTTRKIREIPNPASIKVFV